MKALRPHQVVRLLEMLSNNHMIHIEIHGDMSGAIFDDDEQKEIFEFDGASQLARYIEKYIKAEIRVLL